MAETAAHLVELVIPRVPVRQWVVTFPIPLRHLFATQLQLLSPVLQVIHRALSTLVIHQAGLTHALNIPQSSTILLLGSGLVGLIGYWMRGIVKLSEFDQKLG